jgi:hypothetical protein
MRCNARHQHDSRGYRKLAHAPPLSWRCAPGLDRWLRQNLV